MRHFTGRHMTAIIFGFFGVVIAVNILMATLAVRTFGGTVVDNSYVASQGYNSWLAEAKAQEALGWNADISRTASGHVQVKLTMPQAIPADLQVNGSAIRPLGADPEVELAFRFENGVFLSSNPLPQGRWLIRVNVTNMQDQSARFTQEFAG